MPSVKNHISKKVFFLDVLLGFGLTTFYFQLPLIKMIIDDPQTFYLGCWDSLAFIEFSLMTFVLIPLLIGSILAIFFQKLPFLGRLLFSALIAYFLGAQVIYFLDARRISFPYPPLFINSTIFIAIGLVSFLLHRFVKEIFRVLALGTLVLFAWCYWEVSPHRIGSSTAKDQVPPQIRVVDDGPPLPPVFFLSFEKLVFTYFTDRHGRILKDHFPNLAAFAEDADFYEKAYANSNSTVVSLQMMYTGRWESALWAGPEWKSTPDIRDILGHNKIYGITDMLAGFADPSMMTTYTSYRTSKLTRMKIISSWYKTWLKTVLPMEVQQRMGLYRWNFDPRRDLWGDGQGLSRDEIVKMGFNQIGFLEKIVNRERDNPNLYIMHCWLSDSPPMESTPLRGRTAVEFSHELEKIHSHLKDFDQGLGELISNLKTAGVYDKALIVLVADTGYDPAISYEYGQDELPYLPELSRILLVIKRPGQKEGRIIRSPIQQIDILPTVVEHVGRFPETYGFHGVPITANSNGDSADRPIDIFIRSEHGSFTYRHDSDFKLMRKL
ncbi:MAG: hypothetical protein KCHDKBKB_02628 [Elusimicrobia bacterium]|nr:hypothetical protein [Elusimicrobiota bacterium]